MKTGKKKAIVDVLGIDLGTKSTGLARVSSDSKYTTEKVTATGIVQERFLFMLGRIDQALKYKNIDLVACEYPFGIGGNGKILVEMFGVVKWMCFEYKLPFLSVEQSRLKKYATGNGKAEKSDMVLRAYTEFSLSLSSDECDAFWIAHLGLTSLTMDGLAFRVTSVAEMLKKRKGG